MSMLRKKEWNVIRTHGNKYQAGFPDLYTFHHVYGERWIEIKMPGPKSFTPYQLYYFPIIRRVWVLTGTFQSDYLKLWKDPNFVPNMEHNVFPKKKELEVQQTQEGIRQAEIAKELEAKGWTVMQTYGNNIQRGLPDLYIIKGYTRMWVEVKRIDSFTTAQRHNFPRMYGCGIPIWIVWDDLSILDGKCNLGNYLNV